MGFEDEGFMQYLWPVFLIHPSPIDSKAKILLLVTIKHFI